MKGIPSFLCYVCYVDVSARRFEERLPSLETRRSGDVGRDRLLPFGRSPGRPASGPLGGGPVDGKDGPETVVQAGMFCTLGQPVRQGDGEAWRFAKGGETCATKRLSLLPCGRVASQSSY